MNEGSALLEPKSGYQRKLPIKQNVEEGMRKKFLPREAKGQQNALRAVDSGGVGGMEAVRAGWFVAKNI